MVGLDGVLEADGNDNQRLTGALTVGVRLPPGSLYFSP